MDKFVRELEFLDDDTLYKILWSFIRAGRFQSQKDAPGWFQVRDTLIARSTSIDPRILTKILVLSTQVKEYERVTKENTGSDLWDSFEPRLILKLGSMLLEDLVNLMWSALRINKGTDAFFTEIEKVLRKRVYKFKDEDFQTLIGCVTNDSVSPEFSEKVLQIVLAVVNERKDAFSLRTLVLIIWSLAKLDI
jgi:hypothetical protein